MIVRGNKGKTHSWRAFETLAMLLRLQALELAKLIRHFCVGRSCQSNRTTFAGFRAEFGKTILSGVTFGGAFNRRT